jgi:hypothetical protein
MIPKDTLHNLTGNQRTPSPNYVELVDDVDDYDPDAHTTSAPAVALLGLTVLRVTLAS